MTDSETDAVATSKATSTTTSSTGMSSSSSSVNSNTYVNHSHKTVSFQSDNDLCAYHSGAVLDVEGVENVELWFQFNELQAIKRKALILSKDASHGVGSLLNHCYGRSCPATQEAVYTWSKVCGARRGLERFLHREYAMQRVELRTRTLQSVITAQHKMREEGIDDPTYIALVLAKLSETFSQDPRAFAHVLGVADAYILNDEECYHPQPQQEKENNMNNKNGVMPKPNTVERTKSPQSVMDVVTNNTLLNSASSHSTESYSCASAESDHSSSSAKASCPLPPQYHHHQQQKQQQQQQQQQRLLNNGSYGMRNTNEFRHYF